MEAIFYRTYKSDEATLRNLRNMIHDLKPLDIDIFVVHDATNSGRFPDIEGARIFNFTVKDYEETGYPVAKWEQVYEIPGPPKLGSNIYPIYYNPEYAQLMLWKSMRGIYDHIWYIEWDVGFTGNWRTFFEQSQNFDQDLLCIWLQQKHIGNERIDKFWDEFDFEVKDSEKFSMFGSIWRGSEKLFETLDKEYKAGKHGFYEVIVPTLAIINGMEVTDLNIMRESLAGKPFYDKYTLGLPGVTRYWSERFIASRPNMLFHPVKATKTTMLFATGYCGKDEHITRYFRYINYYIYRLKYSLGVHQMVFIDDGSPLDYLSELQDMVEEKLKVKFHIIDADNLPEILPAGVTWIRFKDNLGRPTMMECAGWWRSFLFAFVVAQKYLVEKIIHIESDCYIISQRLMHYLRDNAKGWTALWWTYNRMPETCIQVIDKENFAKMAKLFEQGNKLFYKGGTNDCFTAENMLPITNIVKCFTGDRVGEDWCDALEFKRYLDKGDYVANTSDMTLHGAFHLHSKIKEKMLDIKLEELNHQVHPKTKKEKFTRWLRKAQLSTIAHLQRQRLLINNKIRKAMTYIKRQAAKTRRNR